MKLRYYLRGLGVGIVVASLVLHFSYAGASRTKAENAQNTQSEDIIIEEALNDEEEERAGETSNIETNTLEKEEAVEQEINTEVASTKEEKNEIAKTSAEEQIDEKAAIEEISEELNTESDEKTIEENIIEEATVEETTMEESDTQVQDLQIANNTSTVEISIVKGDDSGTVARKLYNAGLVDNASEFDYYLMQHGYDKRISVGVVKITPGSTWQEIANKLAGN